MDEEKFLLRLATRDDIPHLIIHRRRMFEDMARLKGESLNNSNLDEMDKVYQQFLTDHFTDGSLKAWVIQFGDRVIAGACLSIIKGFPTHYTNLKGEIPYLHDVYTHPDFRRKGLARKIITEIIEFCRKNKYTILKLHASQEGKPLYDSLGFLPANEMHLFL